MRLFTGIAVPQSVAMSLNGRAHRIASPGLRYTTLENMHVTLYFLGQVSDVRLTELCAAMDSVRVAPLEIVVRTLGTFPRGGVLFAQVDAAPRLTDLQRRLAIAVAPFAARPDPNSPPQGDYHPHITLARSRTPLRLHGRSIQTFPEPIHFTADSVHLYQSRPTPAGSVYEVLHTIR